MTFIRIGLPLVLFLGSRKAGLSVKACHEAGARFSAFQAIAFGETERR